MARFPRSPWPSGHGLVLVVILWLFTWYVYDLVARFGALCEFVTNMVICRIVSGYTLESGKMVKLSENIGKMWNIVTSMLVVYVYVYYVNYVKH